jgi:hypothetical protein
MLRIVHLTTTTYRGRMLVQDYGPGNETESMLYY